MEPNSGSEINISFHQPDLIVDVRDNFFLFFVFAVVLEHCPSQESPKTAKKPPKVPPEGHQEPFQKRVNFLTQFCVQKCFQNWPKNLSKSDPTNNSKNDLKVNTNGLVLGIKMEPEISQIGEAGLQRFKDAGFWKALGPKKAPKWLWMAPKSPR